VIIAHRGASAVETENTVPAFARARSDGADGVELDVMTCGTGEVVVFHDDDLARLGHRPERIADTPFGVLRQVRLASGAAIPTLDEVFEACGPDMLVNVELKIPAGGAATIAPLVDGVAAIVARAGPGARGPCRAAVRTRVIAAVPARLGGAVAAAVRAPPRAGALHRGACGRLAPSRLHGERLDSRRTGGAGDLPPDAS
jgi:hypothetical protein